MPAFVRSHHIPLAVANGVIEVRTITASVDTGAKEICDLDALVADPRAHDPASAGDQGI